jgi:hypothetical protein
MLFFRRLQNLPGISSSGMCTTQSKIPTVQCYSFFIFVSFSFAHFAYRCSAYYNLNFFNDIIENCFIGFTAGMEVEN